MSQVPTPPASRHASASPDAELKPAPTPDSTALMQSLDDLLERYLHLLDQHQKLQSAMASHLSAGFMSLAHANYTCPPGRRYGEDYYDDRMKATRRMQVTAPSGSHDTTLEDEPAAKDSEQRPHTSASYKCTFNITHVIIEDEETPEKDTNRDKSTETDDAPTTESQSNPKDKPETTPSPSDSATDSKSSEQAQSESESDSKPKSKPKARSRSSDPLRWYGILVPPSLRNAQKSFTEAVEGDLPGLASVVLEMQATEKEVNRVRRELGQ